MRACRFALVALLALLAGCATPPQTVTFATDVVVQTTPLRTPPTTVTFATDVVVQTTPLRATPTVAPILPSPVTPTKTPIVLPVLQPTDSTHPTTPVPSPTLAPLATPVLPLNVALHQYVGDALLYTRPDRFLMITDSRNHQSLWLTSGICTMVNDRTEQRGLWSIDGRYLAVTCNQDQNSDRIQTSIVDTQTGKVQQVKLRETSSDSWSPTTPQLLVREVNAATWYVVDARTGQITKLIALSDPNSSAAWSRDGTRVAVTGHRAGQPDAVYILNSDGSHPRRLPVDDVSSSTALPGPVSWSPDGTFLLINRQLSPAPNTYAYQALRLDVGNGHTQILVDTPHATLEFYWSPDGAWFVMGQPGQPGSHVGRWSLYRADGTFLHAISTDPQRDDIAIRWLPDSQRFVIMAVRLTVGVEIITSDLQSNETVIARYPKNGPGFPALAIAPSGTLVAVHLSEQGIAILNLAGQEQAILPGRIDAWRPNG